MPGNLQTPREIPACHPGNGCDYPSLFCAGVQPPPTHHSLTRRLPDDAASDVVPRRRRQTSGQYDQVADQLRALTGCASNSRLGMDEVAGADRMGNLVPVRHRHSDSQ